MKTKNPPLITCRKCHGKGRVFLSAVLNDVYFLVATHRGITPHEISETLKLTLKGFSATAVNQRLDDLLKLNLIERTRIGKAFQYFKKI